MAIDWRRWHVRLGTVGRLRCEAGWHLGEAFAQRLTDFDLWLIWAGRGRMRLRDGEAILRPGVCLWMRPGERYLAEQDLDDRLGVTYIHFDLVDTCGQRAVDVDGLELPSEVQDLADVNFVDALMRRVVELVQPHSNIPAAREESVQQTAAILFTGMLMDIDARSDLKGRMTLTGTQALHHRLIMQMARRISEAPNEAHSVQALARQAGYSPDHFARVFRSVLGRTPHSYIVQTRINRAKNLLQESSLTVSQIADALDYKGVYFFSRQFKQKTGISPTRYRNARV